MNKGMKTLALVLAISATASALTSCNTDDYVYPDYHWQDGLIVTVNDRVYEYEDIYKLMEGKKESAQALYDIASDVVAQLATEVTDDMKADVETDISTLEESWRSNANTNGTSYKEEMENALEDEGVDDLDELRAKKLSQLQIQENEDSYTRDVTLDNGAMYNVSEAMTKRFVEEQRPYHISHILVQVDASSTSSDGTAFYDGHISSANATKLSQVVRQLSSTSSFGSVAQTLSDDSSNANYGELGGSSDDASNAVGLQLSTSYVNEFKLGVYAYDAFLNPDTAANSELVKTSTRMPGAEGIASDITSADALEGTKIGSGQAYGIPLSVALTMGEVADQERSDKGQNVQYTDETQYPRNILFNNYFNNHSVSFIYNDADTYEETFVAQIHAIDASINSIADLEGKPEYTERLAEFNRINTMLQNVSANKFETVDTISGNLVGYQWDADSKDTSIGAIEGNPEIMTDGKGNPIIVVRAGTGSGDSGYQGIHFITVNHDPFVDPTGDYEYWRVNVPKADGTGYDTADYSIEPSYVNYVSSDPGNNSTYQTRIDNVQRAIQGFDANMQFDRFEDNIEIAGTKLQLTGDIGSKLFGENYWKIISQYIENTRDSAKATAEEGLDESWDAYVKLLSLQEDVTPKRVVPTVCINAFQNGSYSDEMEDICHVEK